MTFIVFVAGGVGGYFGAALARAGYPVIFIARGPHLGAIRKDGLHIRSPKGDFNIAPAQSTGRTNGRDVRSIPNSSPKLSWR